jgi:hypothetical protein
MTARSRRSQRRREKAGRGINHTTDLWTFGTNRPPGGYDLTALVVEHLSFYDRGGEGKMRQDSQDTPIVSLLQEFILFLGARLGEELMAKQERKQAVEAIAAVPAFSSVIPAVGGGLSRAVIAAVDRKRNSEETWKIVSNPNNVIDFLKEKQINIALDELSDTVRLLNSVKNLSSNASMGRFSDRERPPRHPSPKPLVGEAASLASARFSHFLEHRGLDKSEAQRISALHQEFIEKELPEIPVLAVVQELRDQFYGEPVQVKQPYLGKTREKEFPDPKEFLFHHYGQEISKGRLTTGRLQEIDPLLYKSLYRDLEDGSTTIGEVVEPRGKPTTQKAVACAAILGTSSLEEAGRFFGGMRADRLAKHEDGADGGASGKKKAPTHRGMG